MCVDTAAGVDVHLSIISSPLLQCHADSRCGSPPPGRHTQQMPVTGVNPFQLCRRSLTSLRSCRHSSTARLLVQVCLGQRRVRSSRQASSSDSFQPVALRGCEAPAATGAGASLAAGSAALRTGGLGGSAGPLAAFKPRTEPKPHRHSNDNNSSSRVRLYAAIFTPLSSN